MFALDVMGFKSAACLSCEISENMLDFCDNHEILFTDCFMKIALQLSKQIQYKDLHETVCKLEPVILFVERTNRTHHMSAFDPKMTQDSL